MKFQLTALGEIPENCPLLTSSPEVEAKTLINVTNIDNNIAEAKMTFVMINDKEVNVPFDTKKLLSTED